jgi:hypothetical protein
VLKIYLDHGSPKQAEISLLDVGPDGVGVETPGPLTVGSMVSVTGEISRGSAREKIHGHAHVLWCLAGQNGAYSAGLSFDDAGSRSFFSQAGAGSAPVGTPAMDYYDVMEVSHKASPDTIHRVYRILAQRYHPDNTETGEEEQFKRLLQAYRVLSDPEQRAAYDVQQLANRQLRWKIFDQPNATRGFEAERRKRQGILSLLYTKRVSQPDQPSLTIHELEDLLGCPREHLEFSLWYLKECAWIQRGDNGRITIAAKGVDQAETALAPNSPDRGLLSAANSEPSE